ASVAPDSSRFRSFARGIHRNTGSAVWSNGRAGPRHITHVYFILGAADFFAALQILRDEFRVEYTLAFHVFDHLRNDGRILTGDDKIKICYWPIILSAYFF